MLNAAADFVWGSGMMVLILTAGIFFTIATRCIQLRLLRRLPRFLVALKSSGNKNKGGISQFQSVCAVLAATMGTGNITGVAAALAIGGAGAVFWMWVSAFFGMALSYCESSLGIYYRYKNELNEWVGGPMAYLEKGLKCRPLAVVYAVLCAAAAFGIGNMTQANSIVSAASYFRIPPLVCGLAVSFTVGIIILGGIKRVCCVTEKTIPIISIIYIAVSAAVIIVNFEKIPAAFAEIFSGAFGIRAAAGGIVGSALKSALSVGVRRGVFSNEAGLGTSSIIHSSAENATPSSQGGWAVFEVFLDTFVCCTLTALAVLTSGALGSETDGTKLVTAAFSGTLGSFSGAAAALCTAVFAFATILGWSEFGAKAASYFLSAKHTEYYRIAFIGAVLVGSLTSPAAVWTLADIFNGLMAVPNIVGVILLSPTAIRLSKSKHLN